MATTQLRQENNRLKDQLSNLQKELNNTRNQLIVLKQSTKSKPKPIQRSKSVKKISNLKSNVEHTSIPTTSVRNLLTAKLTTNPTNPTNSMKYISYHISTMILTHAISQKH